MIGYNVFRGILFVLFVIEQFVPPTRIDTATNIYSSYQVLGRRDVGAVVSQIRVDPVMRNRASRYLVVIDISANKELVYRDGQLIMEIPVSTGSPGRFEQPYYTPEGEWKIIEKFASGGVYGPYFLRLGYWNGQRYVYTSIGMHGTNEPELIGMPASHGCIRHYNADIVKLYTILPIGTSVRTVP